MKEVADYLRRNKVTWPTIVDSQRMFEKLSLNNQVSLKNIWQFRTINSEGEIRIANSSGLDKAINSVLEDASWNIDPQAIPPSLMRTWQSVEFGDFRAAANGVKKALRSSNPQIKAAGDQLNEYVQKHIAQLSTVASDAKEQDDLWLAYRTYSQIEEVFGGYEIETDPGPILKTLKREKTVVDELAALKLLDAVRRRKITSEAAYKGSVIRLKKIIEKYPKTEAARTAGAMLESE